MNAFRHLASAAAALAAALAAAPVLSIGAEPDDRNHIWIEGESAARHNFPPLEKNPFGPQAFWESDLLSGGDWIGAFWKDGDPAPFLEYEIEVPESGVYALYVRKFFSYGNFRWRVGEGEWHVPVGGRLHSPLETVAMRETGERISLSWFYMGEAGLKAGRHVLRIEPDLLAAKTRTATGVGMPLAYDAFLFTTVPFFPNGKLRHGQRHPARDSQGFSFQPGIDRFDSAALDLRYLNEGFAGERGGIVAREGRLVYRNDGQPARMVGVEYTAGRFVSPDALSYMARSLAKRGVNFLRLDIGRAVSFSKNESGRPDIQTDETHLRQLALLAGALKREGIYVALTWNVQTSEGVRALYDPTFKKPDLEAPVYDHSPTPDLAAAFLFDPALGEAAWELWRKVLDLPVGDGGRLGSDPALFLITLAQQSSMLDISALPFDNLPPDAKEALRAAWQKWVGRKHGSFEKAARTWGVEAGPRLADEVPEIQTILQRRDSWSRDGLQFLTETQSEAYARLAKRFREAGYKGLVSCSNQSSVRPELLGLAEIKTRIAGDVIERHGNFRSEFVPKYDVWNFGEGALFGERSILRLDPPKGIDEARFELPWKAPSYEGRPSILTEIGFALPNRFSGEFPLVTFLLSALQDVGAVGFTTMTGEAWQGSLTSSRNQVMTPAIFGQMPALAFAFRNGLMPSASTSGHVELSKGAAFSLQPALFFEAPDSQINAALSAPEPGQHEKAPHPALWLTGRIAVKMDAGSDRFEEVQPGVIHPDRRIESKDGRVRWNPERRLLLVDAPAFQAVAGALRDAGPIRLAALDVRSGMETGVICAVALDGKPLDFSKKILVQAFSEESNTGFNAQAAGDLSVIRSPGRPPLLVRPIDGEITFLRPDADDLASTALDAHGNSLLPASIGSTLRLLPSTFSYLVEK